MTQEDRQDELAEPKVRQAQEPPGPAPQPPSVETDAASLHGILARLREASIAGGAPTYAERRRYLKRLKHAISANRERLAEAISQDFGGRSRTETVLLEVFPVLNDIDHALKHLAEWMEPETVPVGLTFVGGEARIFRQPLGVVGIMGAWNYPYFLTFGPLVAALAAGNRAMIKTSELAPAAAEAIRDVIGSEFDTSHIQVVTGGVETAKSFAALPLDHLFFTGSAEVGRQVMRAAAANLTPVTLELGGKSPAIVHDSFPLKTAVRRIWTGKLLNAGQTCVAPDYLLLPAHRTEEFIELSRRLVAKLYPALIGNPDYTSIATARQYERLIGLLDDAMRRGADCLPLAGYGESLGSAGRIMAPIVVLHGNDDMAIMQEEIFGPILPIVPYIDLEEAIAYVNRRPRPLALYYFDRNGSRIERVLRETVSGGVTVNDVILHIGQSGLPFGGVGPSGMGRYHGVAGFRTFSNEKAVFYQGRFASTRLLSPPYGKVKQSVVKFLTRG